MDDGEDQYVSDELGSSYPDAFEDEKLPKYEKLKKEKLEKDYEFKLGMEFNSLTDFKDAIIEWLVLNGRENTFVKKESNMVKVKCKGKYSFLALCSKVGGSQTFKIKTCVGTHTCARVLNNRSVKSKWIAKVMVINMTIAQHMLLCNDILIDYSALLCNDNCTIGVIM